MKKVYVAFDWDNDKHYKYLLEAWDANPNFEFDFSDQSPDEILSEDVSRVKAVITSKIRQSDFTLVIAGKGVNSYHEDRDLIGCRNWINFESMQSVGVTNIAVVKLDDDCSDPIELNGEKYSYIVGFTEENIINVLEHTSNN